MLALLSPKQRALLEILVLYPGEVNSHYISKVAAAAEIVTLEKERAAYYYTYYYKPEPGDPSKDTSTRLADLVAGLSARVLALTTGEGGYGNVTVELGVVTNVTVPAEMRPPLVDLLAPALLTVAVSPAPVDAADPRTAHRALFLIWSSVRAKPAGLTQAGLVRKVDARRLGQALGVADKNTTFDAENDLPLLYFVRRMAQQLDLLTLSRDWNLEAAGREPIQALLAEPWPRRTLRMLRTWLEGAGYDLPLVTDNAAWRSSRHISEAMATAGYTRLLDLVAGVPDAWVVVEDFVRWVRLHHFGFLALPDDDPGAVHDFGTALYRLTYGAVAATDPWDPCEGALVRTVLRGPLHWLGLVDLAGAEGPQQAFRLTATGRTLLAALRTPAEADTLLAPLVATATGGRVIVQPNFQVLAVGDVPDETLFALTEVAELIRAEQAVEFKLTRESVYGAQQAGWTPVAILDLLRRASGGPVAQNVERSILDWAAAHDRVVIHRDVTLLAAREPALLDRLMTDPATAPLLGERLLPTLTLVQAGNGGPAATIAELDGRLLAAGELPATSDLTTDSPRPSFSFDAAGRVTWSGPLPDLRLLGLLAGITRAGAGGTLALDERTLRATAATRRWGPADVTALLDLLAAWHSGPVPEAVVRQIKIWAGYQGRAQLRTVTILTVDRPELLADLQADP
ncbi:MAG TPA: helicase-associated domain-containing protein, partial [Chloroflexia bacterium]|nr:helicase-associated domain-containing protein [Chloroflexia bacterium]